MPHVPTPFVAHNISRPGAPNSAAGDAVSGRRRFLARGTSGLLSALALARTGTVRASGRAAEPPRAARHCILVYLLGGPSHLDLWDPKPAAPAEIRGPFKPISTAVPGLHFTEHLPLAARRADRFALVRSVSHDNNDQPN